MTDATAPSSYRVQAMRAWSAIGTGDVVAADIVEDSDKSTVLRLRLEGAVTDTVIAKRSAASSVALERKVYREVLEWVAIDAARYLGYAPDDDPEAAWLFLEDVPGGNLDDPTDAGVAAELLAAMHTSSLELNGSPDLPDRGPAYFHARLLSARRQLIARLAASSVFEWDDRVAIETAVRVCDQVEASWCAVESFVQSLPTVFVHGDFSPSNLRMRVVNGHRTVVPLDWEKAGWGTAPVDLAWADVVTYQDSVRVLVPSLGLQDTRRLKACSDVFRVLSHNWARKRVRRMAEFASRLAAAVASLERETTRDA
jgi:hypothetical protein